LLSTVSSEILQIRIVAIKAPAIIARRFEMAVLKFLVGERVHGIPSVGFPDGWP
jgi:hypothetical protein